MSTLTFARHRYWWTRAGDAEHLTLTATPYVGDLVRTACGRWLAARSRALTLPKCRECDAARREARL